MARQPSNATLMRNYVKHLKAERDALKAEVERLRTDLPLVIDLIQSVKPESGYITDTLDAAESHLRAALKEDGSGVA